MDEGFKARVERLFGSHLFQTVPKSSFPASSWSVVEGQVEKKEWNRERGESHPGREDTPLASSYDDCFAKSSGRYRNSEEKRFEEDLEEDKAGEDEEGDELDREERDIRSSIGLDSTLDFEEEEDEFDRAAVGMEEIGERLYMKDVKDRGSYVDYNCIEETSEELVFARDPRADHAAASKRLKEDDEGGPPSRSPPSIRTPGVDSDLKPILKRKFEQAEGGRPRKQVRFDAPTAAAEEEEGDPKIATVDPRIPDYLRNPSKYVRYSLESDGTSDEASNRQAFSDFWEIVRRRKEEEAGGATPPPGSVPFIPRKRVSDLKPPGPPPNRQVSAAASDQTEQEENEDDVAADVPVRPSRRYRSKPVFEK